MTSQQRLYLMLGYPGAGKTTTARVLHELTGAEHIWADHERRQRFENPTYSPEENAQLYEELNQKTAELLAEGKSVVYDTAFNFYTDRELLADIAQHHNVETIIVWVTTPKTLAKARATEDSQAHDTRVLGNMPANEFERMSNNLQEPEEDEKVMEVDGTRVTSEYIQQLLSEL